MKFRNRDEILFMAHEACKDMSWYPATLDTNKADPDEVDFLERFAALVAASEREACAKVCEEIALKVANGTAPLQAQNDYFGGDYFARMIRARDEK